MPRKPITSFGSAKPEACKSSAEICHIAVLEKGDELFLLKGRSSPSKCLKKLLFLPRAEGSRVLGWGMTQGSFWGSGLGGSSDSLLGRFGWIHQQRTCFLAESDTFGIHARLEQALQMPLIELFLLLLSAEPGGRLEQPFIPQTSKSPSALVSSDPQIHSLRRNTQAVYCSSFLLH